ncbi:MAG: energy-coupling factor transporter ATPase [bacterium]
MIQIKNVSFSYNKKENVLKNINLDIKKGEWISIVGHNGSGKSTLSKILIGILEKSEGEIIVDDIPFNKDTINDIRKKIGIVFQNPDNQFVGVTVKHDIAFGLENRVVAVDEMNKIIDETASLVSMDKFVNSEPHNLSGGQKQRVAIASVLALNTDYIIFDEATSMLDPKGVEDISKLIKVIQQMKDKTIITITHDLNLAKFSDTVVVLKDGNIIAKDKPEVIFTNEELLISSNLDMPFYTKAYTMVKTDEKLKENKKLVDLLWHLSSKE